MKILTASQIKIWEEKYITSNSSSEIELVKKAAHAAANWIDKKLMKDNMPIAVLCGWGNNGADGFATAQLLLERKSPVTCFVLSPEKQNNTCSFYANQFEGITINVETVQDLVDLPKFDIVVDAILGIGINRSPNPLLFSIFETVNIHSKHIMSLDIPSGMFADIQTEHPTIKANQTIAFSLPKLSFFSSTNENRLGDWIIRDLGIQENLKMDEKIYFIDKSLISRAIPKRSKFAHKGTFGHVAAIGGEYGKTGAILMTAKAALRSGAGLVSIGSSNENRIIAQIGLPEAMFFDALADGTDWLPSSKINVLAIGPGMGISTAYRSLVYKAFDSDLVTIFDADALRVLKEDNLLNRLNSNCILTPHPGEFDLLFGETKNDFQRRALQISCSIKYNCFIILKGAYSTITDPDGKIYYNSTGNPGMAKGGSGDLLTGIIAAFVAQGHTLLQSCLMGTYLHGLAGDLAAKDLGEQYMMPNDIIDRLGLAIKMIQ